jgi:Flp pilus assembly protein CpaB
VHNKLALIVAVVLGVLSIVGIRLYVDNLEKQNILKLELIDVFVASKDLPVGEMISADDVDIAQFSAQFMDQAFRRSHITDKATIMGSRTVERIAAGQVLQEYHFEKRVTGPKLKFKSEYRAITIPISRVGGVAGLLKPTDSVDVVINTQLNDRSSGAELVVTRTLFKNVLILATDSNTDPYVETSGYSTVTLRLTPDECNKMAFCMFNGAAIQLLYVQPGTPEDTKLHPFVADDLFLEIERELRERRGG